MSVVFGEAVSVPGLSMCDAGRVSIGFIRDFHSLDRFLAFSETRASMKSRTSA